MRKGFLTYFITWIIFLVLFNIVIFVIPSSIDGETIMNVVKVSTTIKGGAINSLDASLIAVAKNLESNNMILDKYAGAFWPGYIFVILVFIVQLICSYIAFSEKNNQKFFYKVPLITISYTGLIVTSVVGIICMFIPNVPIWLGIVLCLIVLIITIVSLLKANLASSIISSKDDEIANSTAFMKEMTAKAKALWDADKNNEDLRKLYEAFRYADPKINANENEIRILLNGLISCNSKQNINELIGRIKDN